MKRTSLYLFLIMFMGTNVYGAQDGLDIAAEIYFANYEEPNFMEEEGAMYSIVANYTHRWMENQPIESIHDLFSESSTLNMFLLEGRFGFGWLDYTSNGTGTLDDIDDISFELRGAVGYDFPVSEGTTITPYLGLGYRYLNDDSGGRTTTTGHFGYERESNYFYLPFGLDLLVEADNDWSYLLNVEFDVFLYGQQKSHLGDAVAGLNTVENDQNDGYGVRGSFKIAKDMVEYSLFMQPFIRYWHVNDSDISAVTFNGVLVGFGLEPENNTLETGIRFGIHF